MAVDLPSSHALIAWQVHYGLEPALLSPSIEAELRA